VLTTLEKYYENGLLHKQTHPNLDLTIWNYSPKVQYERLWDEITIQCRGLVTNSKGDIVARPFKKFFNYEEHKPEEIPNFQVLVAGFPCQPYSIAGLRQGLNDEKGRGQVFLSILKIDI